jgi:hypothetical protein
MGGGIFLIFLAASGLVTAGWVGMEFSRLADRDSSPSFIGPECGLLAHIQGFPGFTAQLELGYQPDDGVSHLGGLDQAWLGWGLTRWDVRAGLLRVPFGAEDESRHPLFSRLVTRPYALSEVVPLPWTNLGVATNGTIKVPFGTLSSSFMVSNGLVMGRTIRESRPILGEPDNNSNKALTGRLGFSLPLDAQFGISGHFGARDPNDRKNLALGGLDGTIKVGGFELRGEYAGALLDTELGVLKAIQFTAASFIPHIPMPDAKVGGWAYGWHLQAGRWWGERTFLLTRLDRLRYVDYTRSLERSWDRIALGMDFYPQPLLVLKTEFDFISLEPNGFHLEVGVGF